jgi:hypothetical protein
MLNITNPDKTFLFDVLQGDLRHTNKGREPQTKKDIVAAIERQQKLATAKGSILDNLDLVAMSLLFLTSSPTSTC